MPKKIKTALRNFFFPPAGSPRWTLILPYVVLGILSVIVLTAGAAGWEYTNSPQFCGYTCHTMPPQNATYLVSPHANVYCTECHIGRGVLGTQLSRKTEDLYEVYSMVFHVYEFPLQASRTRPARETCEQCHLPETFSDDSLRVINHYQADESNTPSSTYLILKTGGGAKTQGLGKGIHWHIVNKVEFYTTDPSEQDIPYVRVYNDDGTVTGYLDVESDIVPAQIDPADMKTMDCITCHNRVSHNFQFPAEAVDSALASGLIATDIPFIRAKAVEALSASYASNQEAMEAIAGLEQYYQDEEPEYYGNNADKIAQVVNTLQEIYNRTVFLDQKVDWTTHPNNIGHLNTAGCFRCHDGKHLDNQLQAIRLECNLCHSIPVVADSSDFVTQIEISRGPEPASHLNPNWISLHHDAFDTTCQNCHDVEDPGGTSNTSFCSNSACHGNSWTYAGFDAPTLRSILQLQVPPPAPVQTPAPVVGNPTFTANIQPILTVRCTACHNSSTAPMGLDLSTYAATIKGGTNGAVIIPGDAVNSILVIVQSAQHFANFNAEELKLTIDWINAGALEK